LALAVAGTVLLARRSPQRNQHKEEIGYLKRRRKELARSLRYAANVGRDELQLGLTRQL
jgi:hypothetical protein